MLALKKNETAIAAMNYIRQYPVTPFPQNIQSNFTALLTLKKIEMKIAAMKYIRQYQLNFC